MAEHVQMSRSAIGNLKRNPSKIERKREPGIANVCRLKIIKRKRERIK
jgi:hypothetical protein